MNFFLYKTKGTIVKKKLNWLIPTKIYTSVLQRLQISKERLVPNNKLEEDTLFTYIYLAKGSVQNFFKL